MFKTETLGLGRRRRERLQDDGRRRFVADGSHAAAGLRSLVLGPADRLARSGRGYPADHRRWRAWQEAATGLPAVDGFKFVDASHGWAWHNASLGLAHTTDGGRTWTLQSTGSDTLSGLQFVDPLHGWVREGDYRLRRTTDGGANVAAVTSPPVPDSLQRWRLSGPCIRLCPSRLGHRRRCNCDRFICNAHPSSMRTDDGGLSWGPVQTSGPSRALFLDEEHGFGYFARGVHANP